jgi:hypothetical protein
MTDFWRSVARDEVPEVIRRRLAAEQIDLSDDVRRAVLIALKTGEEVDPGPQQRTTSEEKKNARGSPDRSQEGGPAVAAGPGPGHFQRLAVGLGVLAAVLAASGQLISYFSAAWEGIKRLFH